MYTPPPPELFDITNSNECIAFAMWVAAHNNVEGSYAVIIPAATGTVALVEDCPNDATEARNTIIRMVHQLSHPSVEDVAVVTVSADGYAEYWRLNGTDVVMYPVTDG